MDTAYFAGMIFIGADNLKTRKYLFPPLAAPIPCIRYCSYFLFNAPAMDPMVTYHAIPYPIQIQDKA